MRRARRASALVEAERGVVPTGPAVWGGAVPRRVFGVGRDVVLLWRSAECGIAVQFDTTAGKHPEPLRLSLRSNAGTKSSSIRRSAIQEMRTSGPFALG